jgi:hypothetical protein
MKSCVPIFNKSSGRLTLDRIGSAGLALVWSTSLGKLRPALLAGRDGRRSLGLFEMDFKPRSATKPYCTPLHADRAPGVRLPC